MYRRNKIRWVRATLSVKKYPWKLLFLLLPIVIFLSCWFKRDTLFTLVIRDFRSFPNFITKIFAYIFYLLIILGFVLLQIAILHIVGVPRNDKKISRGLFDLFRNDAGYGKKPIYLSCQREGNLWRYLFYSEHVPLQVWEEKNARGSLMNLLGGYVVDINYGGENNNDIRYIVVLAGIGAKPQERKTPIDPLFRA